MRKCLKRNEIIRGRKIFRQIYTGGLEYRGRYILCKAAPIAESVSPGEFKYSLGINVGRSVKRAVDRNRIKRIVREAYRINKNILSAGTGQKARRVGLLFIYLQNRLSDPRKTVYNDIELDVKNILIKISKANL